jgi:hypothetical protein
MLTGTSFTSTALPRHTDTFICNYDAAHSREANPGFRKASIQFYDQEVLL